MTQWLLLSDFCFLLDAFLVFHVFGDRTLINIEIRKKKTNVFQVLLQQQEREFTFAEEEARRAGLCAIPFLAHTLHGHALREEPRGSERWCSLPTAAEGHSPHRSDSKSWTLSASPHCLPDKVFFFLVKCEVSQSIWVGARDSKRTQVLSRAGLASKQTSLYKGRASVGPGTQLSVQYERKACHDELY